MLHIQTAYQKLFHRHQLSLVGDGESEEEGEDDDDRVHQGSPHCTDLKALWLDDEPVSVYRDGHVGQGRHVDCHTGKRLDKSAEKFKIREPRHRYRDVLSAISVTGRSGLRGQSSRICWRHPWRWRGWREWRGGQKVPGWRSGRSWQFCSPCCRRQLPSHSDFLALKLTQNPIILNFNMFMQHKR